MRFIHAKQICMQVVCKLVTHNTLWCHLPAVVVAMAAPVGPNRSHPINITSRERLTRFEPIKMAKVVRVSRYPRRIPVEAEMTKTAGAATARMCKKDFAYQWASSPASPVPMIPSRAPEKVVSTRARSIPNRRARLNACPPTSIAPASSPDARRWETRGVVTVQRKLNR